MSLKIVYEERKLSDVLAYWVGDYEPVKGEKILKGEHIIDAAKDRVVFKLFVEIKGSKKK